MIPKETKCKYCGKRIYFVPTERGLRPVEAGWTPFRRGGTGQHLYTNEGLKIPCEILPESRADEAEGYAHIFHFCPRKPIYHRPKPLTAREKYRERYE